MSKPEPGAIFDTASAVRSAVTAMPRVDLPHTEAPPLSPDTLSVTAKPYRAAYSPIVLAGLVRVIEFALVAAVGFAVYVVLCGADARLRLALFRRHLRHLAAGHAGVPDGRHLSGPGVPRPREAIHAARLGVVRGVSDRHQRFVLRQSRRPVLPRLARRLLRARAVRADRLPARACFSWCAAGRAKAGSIAAPSSSAPTATAKS